MFKRFIILFILVFVFVLVVTGQYYEFTGDSDNGFQQGCPETYDIYFNTETENGITIGQPLVILDDDRLFYSNASNGVGLRDTLFHLDSSSNLGFVDWISRSYPQWNTEYTKIYLNAKNEDNNSVLGYHRYGYFFLTPKYNYTGVDFVFDYDGSNDKTVLGKDGLNVINSGSQSIRLTGFISIEQKPCLDDTISPDIDDNIYIDGATRLLNNGLNINLTEIVSQGNVPFVWTGGSHGIGVWTGSYSGNIWGINNQYGVDSGTVFVTVVGNGTSVILDYDDFVRTPINFKTREYKDRDYNIIVGSGQLFNFGIEKAIDIFYTGADRLGNLTYKFISFNNPVDPYVTATYPLNNQIYVVLDDSIKFKISDDWAGVDSGSVVVTLSGLDNDFYGVYSGIDLSFSGVSGVANYPDYYVTLNHSNFPISGTISVNVYGLDLGSNGGDLANWEFTTRPDCTELGCCSMKLQTGDETTRFDYINDELYISGGDNAYLTGFGSLTGYIDCNISTGGLNIYQGHGADNTGLFVGFHDLGDLILEGSNVSAILSGNTLILSRVVSTGCIGHCAPIIIECDDDTNDCSYYCHDSADICGVDKSHYSVELKGAYLYSYMYGITTMCPIRKADLDGYLRRNHFAKMISEFAVNVLGREPDIGKAGCDSFDDINGDTEELKGFMKTSCELSLMGLHSDGTTPKDSFDPSDYVTRAQFGTVFSRLLFGDKYNIKNELSVYHNEGYWYKEHLKALKDYGVMTKIDGDWPNTLELRGWVMLMMQRADNYGLFVGMIPIFNGIDALFD